MAVWQVDFHVVPRRALASSIALEPAVLVNTEWWANIAFPADYATRLSGLAAAASSSGTGVEAWGREDGNRVDVWLANGRVRKMVVRVDVRHLDSKFGAALIGFVRTADAVLVRGDGLVVEPTIAAYAGALRNSAAWRHANDPAEFLAKHVDEEDEE